jgi:RHS repeat-associated protein
VSGSDHVLWSQSYGYDQYGNQWTSSSTGITLPGNATTSNVYNTATNQIGDGNYDSAGNRTSVSGNTLSFNGENQVVSINDPAIGGTETIGYDGLGQRVIQNLPGGTVVYVYDAFGQLAAEYHSAVATTPVCSTCYLSSDWLGSTRLVTDASGNVVSRHDFTPFGQEIAAGTAGRDSSWAHPDGVRSKFTGQLRDTETGMDYFIARYYGNALGRFVSPDPGNAGADPSDPQTWNAYAYVRNNPLALVDPLGLDPQPASGQPGCTWDPDTNTLNCGGTGYPGCVAYGTEGCIRPVTIGGGPGQISTPPTGGGGGGNPAGNPPNTGNTSPNLPKQTTNLFTIPGTNYCGPGGSGLPTDRVDAGCAAHDRCYERAGVSWRNNVGLARTTPQQRAAIRACDADLSNALMHIYLPTSAEMGQATIVSTFFNLPSGYSLR